VGASSEDAPVFTQDGAPPHRPGITQAFLKETLGEKNFWPPKLWPPSSPEVNPLDRIVWPLLREKVSKLKPRNVSDLRGCILAGCDELFSEDFVKKVTSKDATREILEKIVQNQGGQID